jgi:hypothetical protein
MSENLTQGWAALSQLEEETAQTRHFFNLARVLLQ